MVEQGNQATAAKALGISQVALHGQLVKLEHWAGKKLYRYNTATMHGLLLYGIAKKYLEEKWV